MDLDVDGDLVGLGHFEDLAVAPLHHLHGLGVGEPLGLVQAVGRGDPRAAGVLGPGDRLQHVGHAVERAVLARKRIGRVHLGEPHAVALHLPPQQQRVLVEGHVRLVAQPVNPAHAVDQPALDEVDVVLLAHWRHFSKFQ